MAARRVPVWEREGDEGARQFMAIPVAERNKRELQRLRMR